MRLKSFGCSFIFGTDLADEGHHDLYSDGSKLTWPALLANDLGYAYQTYARPGSGNLQILERMLDQCCVNEPSVFVVGWTYIDRFDYLNRDKEKWPGTPWKTILPTGENETTKMYFKHFHSQLQDKLCALIYIKTAIDTLKQKNIRFIMTYIDPLIFESEWHCTPAIIELQNYVRPYMTMFEDKTFLEFTRFNDFPISNIAHPLEEAHQQGAKLIKSYNLL